MLQIRALVSRLMTAQTGRRTGTQMELSPISIPQIVIKSSTVSIRTVLHWKMYSDALCFMLFEVRDGHSIGSKSLCVARVRNVPRNFCFAQVHLTEANRTTRIALRCALRGVREKRSGERRCDATHTITELSRAPRAANGTRKSDWSVRAGDAIELLRGEARRRADQSSQIARSSHCCTGDEHPLCVCMCVRALDECDGMGCDGMGNEPSMESVPIGDGNILGARRAPHIKPRNFEREGSFERSKIFPVEVDRKVW